MNKKKLLFFNMKERLWLFLLILITGFFVFPVRALYCWQMSLKLGQFSENPVSLRTVRDVLGITHAAYNTLIVVVIIVVAAFIAAAVTFRYLHDTTGTDFWNSLAIKRRPAFMINALSGALLVLIPFAIDYLIAAAICAGVGATSTADAGAAAFTFFSYILCFLAVYLLSCLCHLLSGRTVIGVLLSGFFMVAGPLYVWLFEMLSMNFYTHIVPGSGTDIAFYLSPAASVIFSGKERVITAAIYAAIFLILCLTVISKRPSETAGRAFAFKKTAAFVKIIVTVPAALLAAVLISTFNGNIQLGWFIFIMLITAILVPIVMDLIFALDFRAIKKGLPENLLALGITIFITVVFTADLFGINRYIPPTGDVTAAGVSDRVVSDPQGYLHTSDDEPLYLSETPEAIEAVRSLAESSMNNELGLEAGGYANGNFGSNNIALAWKTKDGKLVLRQYYVKTAAEQDALNTLTLDPEFRKTAALAKDIDFTKENVRVTMNGWMSGDEPELVTAEEQPLSKEQRAGLSAALSEDEAQMTYNEYLRSTPLYTINVEPIGWRYSDGDIYYYGSLNIYPEFKNTLKLLGLE